MTDEAPIQNPLRFDAEFSVATGSIGCGSDARYEDDTARWHLTAPASISVAGRAPIQCGITLTDNGRPSRADFGTLLLPTDGEGTSLWLDLYPSQWSMIVQTFMMTSDAVITIHATTSMDAATEEEAFAARIVVFGISISRAPSGVSDGRAS